MPYEPTTHLDAVGEAGLITTIQRAARWADDDPGNSFRDFGGDCAPDRSAGGSVMSPIHRLVAVERRRQRGRLLVASTCAAAASACGVLLLGVSGWFITATAFVGAGGSAAVLGFNYLLPSAFIRLAAILRTGGRYAERVSGHDAALRALARIRPAIYRAIAAAPAHWAITVSAGDAVARVVEDVGEVEARFVRRPSTWG